MTRMLRRLAFPALLAGLLGLAFPAAAQNVAAGRDVYDNICRGCHGFPPTGGPERAANNPTLIARALNTVPAMQPFSSTVTSQQIIDIAAYIGSLSGPPAPVIDATDLWWNETESGWGLNLIQHASGVVFGVMYTYDTTGKPAWFVMPEGRFTNATTLTGAFYRATGPSQAGPSFDPSRVAVRQVGTATITFQDANRANFTFTVDGTTVTKFISRQPF